MKHARLRSFVLLLACTACGGGGFYSLNADDGGDDAASDVLEAAAADVDAAGVLDASAHDGESHADASKDAPELVDASDGGAPVDAGDAGHDSGLCCLTKGNAPTTCNTGQFLGVFSCVIGWVNDASPNIQSCEQLSPCLVGQWCQVANYVIDGAPSGTVGPCP